KAGPCDLIQQLQLKLLKKLMMVLTERSQNTQCIAVCCVWGCMASQGALVVIMLCLQYSRNGALVTA
ncbi:hypothetical protein QTP86_026003, partial [Hemibagrus guttatus]